MIRSRNYQWKGPNVNIRLRFSTSFQKMSDVPDDLWSDTFDHDSIPETMNKQDILRQMITHQEKRLLITWRDFNTLAQQAETLGKHEHYTIDQKMVLLCFQNLLHANSKLVNPNTFAYEASTRFISNKRQDNIVL